MYNLHLCGVENLFKLYHVIYNLPTRQQNNLTYVLYCNCPVSAIIHKPVIFPDILGEMY